MCVCLYVKEEEEGTREKNTLIVDLQYHIIWRKRQWTAFRLCYCFLSFQHTNQPLRTWGRKRDGKIDAQRKSERIRNKIKKENVSLRDVVVLERRKKKWKLRIKIERKERKMKSRLVGHLCVICCVYIRSNKNKNINGSMSSLICFHCQGLLIWDLIFFKLISGD